MTGRTQDKVTITTRIIRGLGNQHQHKLWQQLWMKLLQGAKTSDNRQKIS
jgi:hypothetical protein